MLEEDKINMKVARKMYDELVSGNLPDSDVAPLSFDEVISVDRVAPLAKVNADTEETEGVKKEEKEEKEEKGKGESSIAKAEKYAKRLGLSTKFTDGAIGHAFVNGRYVTLDDVGLSPLLGLRTDRVLQNMFRVMQFQLQRHQEAIQEAVSLINCE
jgi:hypothetical protein